MAIAAEVRLAGIAHLKNKAKSCRELADQSFGQGRSRWLSL